MDNEYMEYSPEFENFEFENFEYEDSEQTGEGEVFTEAELMELAGELMEVNSEAELDQFLGKLIKRAGRAVRGVIRSPIGRAIGGYLKSAAKNALPLAGAAVGTYFGGPLGAKIGSGLASAAGGAMGLEAETLNAEDREFEGAKQFVRMGGEAVKSALAVPPGVNPASAAQQAVTAAAATHAPGLACCGGSKNPSAGPRGASGRWVRKGPNVLLLNY
jgi:hypothetical protein